MEDLAERTQLCVFLGNLLSAGAAPAASTHRRHGSQICRARREELEFQILVLRAAQSVRHPDKAFRSRMSSATNQSAKAPVAEHGAYYAIE